MSRRVTRPRFLTQALAMVLIVSLVRPGNGAPGDVFSVPAPMLGADPPAGADLRDGDASVSTQTGAFQYAYPVTVPPGRLGNQPSLALSYSSQAPIYGGIAAGWSLSIPEIQRDTEAGTLVQFEFEFDEDQREGRRFLSTMAGSRPLIETNEPKANGVYATFRAQNDTSYARYEWMEDGQPFHWRVYTPDGTTHYFGDSNLITGTPVEMDRVPLTRTVDEFGNTVTYKWIREGNGLYIDEIEYTSNPGASLPPFAKVKFSWNPAATCGGSPVGSLVRFQGGYERVGAKTLALITATSWDLADPRAVHTRQFTFGYDASVEGCNLGHAPYRQLRSIQESAWGPLQPLVALPPVTFTYGPAGRSQWATSTHGTWTNDENPGAMSWGKRFNGNAWPTVETMLMDFDGDGLVDRLRSSHDSQTCVLSWDQNTGETFQIMPDIPLPHLPWAEPMTPETGCSLNGQQTFYRNQPIGSATCGPKNDGSYLAYRWLDIDANGLPDLVTAIHHDVNLYDPNAISDVPPFGAWPECQDAPASLLLQDHCMEAALVYCDGEACGLDGDQVADCLDDPGNEYETVFKTQACDGGLQDTIACENGGMTSVAAPCDFPRVPHERCGRYPWIIYFNEGNGELGPPVIKYSPIPLESDSGDSPSGVGGFSSTVHALIDIDGDSYLDAISIPRYDTDTGDGVLPTQPHWWWVWKGAGNGEFRGDATGRPFFWFTPEGANPAVNASEWSDGNGNSTSMATAGLVDFNGDGLQDYYVRNPDTQQVRVYWNHGSGFRVPGETLAGITSVSRTSFIADTVQWPGPWISAGRAVKRTAFVDHDDDGRPDLLHSTSSDGILWGSLSVRFNNGLNLLGGYGPAGDELDVLWGQETEADLIGGQPHWETRTEVVDLDGDGSVEEVTVGAGNVIQKLGRPADAPPARLMTAVDNGVGLHTVVAYAPLSDSNVVTTQAESRHASPQTKWMVTSLTTTDDFMPAGTESVFTYKYTYPVWRPDDRGEWGFRGFETVRATNPRGAYVEETFGYNIDWSGRLVETITVPTEDQPTGARAPTSISSTEWARFSLFNGSVVTFHPTITRTLTCNRGQAELACRSNPAALQKSEQVWTAQAGLLFAKTIDKLQDSETQDSGDRFTTTSYVLLSDLDDYRLRSTVVESKVLEGAGQETYAKSATLWFNEYREARQEIVWLDDSTTATTARTFDVAGNVVTVQKPEQFAAGEPVTQFVFDDAKRFVRSTINELGHVVETYQEPGTGATLRTVGPNSHSCYPSSCGSNLGREESRNDVDGLGRALATWVSRDAAPGYTLVKVAEISYVDTPSGTTTPTSTTSRGLIEWDGVRWTEERTSFDGHGRRIESLVVTSPQARTTYAYDEDGTLASVTLPDPSASSGSVIHRYTFDSLGRATGIERPDGSGIGLAYDGTVNTRSEVTGSAGGPAAVTELVHDSFGRLVVVREQTSPSFAETFYDFDPRDTVSRIEDADGISTVLEHDRAGRRTKITRESRIWEYVYDRNGNLTAEISPVPGSDPGLIPAYTTLYAYDSLDRLTSRAIAPRDLSEDDLELFGINEITYRYDVSGNGLNRIGRLAETETLDPVGNTVLRKTFTYDAQGNVTEDRLSYFLAGVSGERRIKTSHGPGGKVVEVDLGDGVSTDVAGTIARYSFDERANPSAVETKLATGGPFTSQAQFVRNPAGLVTQRLRNGTPSQTALWTYDPLGRITRQRVLVGSTTVADQTLSFWGSDDPKTLTYAADGIEQRAFEFFYDDRHQLQGVTTAESSFSSSYAFTSGGRLAHATVNGVEAEGSDVRNRDVDYVYQASDPEMMTSLEGPGGVFATYDYDDAGNVIRRNEEGERTNFLWDGDDQLRRAESDDESREEYYYAPDGARVALFKRTLTDGLWTATQVKLFHGPLEVWLAPDGSATHRLAHVGMGTPIARLETEAGSAPTVELQYHSTLQSLLVALGSDGSVKASFAYGPYGEVLQESGSQTGSHRRRYNDKHKDELTGLHYYGYRYYDSTSLLWTAADPLFRFAPDKLEGSPRLANLYTFDLNNPMRYVDPDGRFPWIVVPLVIGAGMFAAEEGCNQYQAGEFDPGRMANAVMGGIVAGAVTMAGGTTPWSAGGGYAFGKTYQRTANGEDTSLSQVATEVVVGAAVAKIAGEMLKLAARGLSGQPAGEAPATKGPPNPGGRLGSEETRAQNAQIADGLEAEGYTVTGGAGRAPEEYIPGPGGGTKGSTYVDVTAKNGSDTVRVQTVDTRANGAPTRRELKNAAKILKANPKEGVVLVPKNKPKKAD